MTETTHTKLGAQLHDRFSELRAQYGAEAVQRIERFVALTTGQEKRPTLDPLQNPELYFFPDITNRAWHEAPAWMPQLVRMLL